MITLIMGTWPAAKRLAHYIKWSPPCSPQQAAATAQSKDVLVLF
jgi:hypothetical protein